MEEFFFFFFLALSNVKLFWNICVRDDQLWNVLLKIRVGKTGPGPKMYQSFLVPDV